MDAAWFADTKLFADSLKTSFHSKAKYETESPLKPLPKYCDDFDRSFGNSSSLPVADLPEIDHEKEIGNSKRNSMDVNQVFNTIVSSVMSSLREEELTDDRNKADNLIDNKTLLQQEVNDKVQMLINDKDEFRKLKASMKEANVVTGAGVQHLLMSTPRTHKR